MIGELQVKEKGSTNAQRLTNAATTPVRRSLSYTNYAMYDRVSVIQSESLVAFSNNHSVPRPSCRTPPLALARARFRCPIMALALLAQAARFSSES